MISSDLRHGVQPFQRFCLTTPLPLAALLERLQGDAGAQGLAEALEELKQLTKFYVHLHSNNIGAGPGRLGPSDRRGRGHGAEIKPVILR